LRCHQIFTAEVAEVAEMTQSRREKTELCAISVPLWSIRIWEVLKTG